MPNTLIHIAIQAPLSRAAFPKTAIPWILAGAIIPDIPWIFQRILFASELVNPYEIRLFCTVQASLFFCLLMSLVLSSFSKKPFQIFLVLASNSLFHLLLDALQIKWGNGVHLLAPLSWHSTNWGLLWPENYLGYLLSFLGACYLCVKIKSISREGLMLHISPLWKASIICLLFYFTLPFTLMNSLEKSDSNYIRTIRIIEERPGQSIEIDRTRFSKKDSSLYLFSGEVLGASGTLPDDSGIISLKGVFTSTNSIKITAYHFHNKYRDYASKIGLGLTLFIWLTLLFIERETFLPIRKNK